MNRQYQQPYQNKITNVSYMTPQYQPIQNTGLSILNNCQSIFIKQRPDWIENYGLCERKNVYYIYQSDINGNTPNFETQIPIFKCKEESNWCQRNCFPGNCRPFKMKIAQYNPNYETQTIFQLNREFKCTFLCFQRPIMEVQLENGEIIGSLQFPFLCCDKGVDIYNIENEIIYKIRGSCCQCPFLFNLPCETCQKAKFDILDQQGNKISELWKQTSGFCESLCTDASNFLLIYPQIINSIDRALLLAATLFLDYNYFEKSYQDNNNNNQFYQ